MENLKQIFLCKDFLLWIKHKWDAILTHMNNKDLNTYVLIELVNSTIN